MKERFCELVQANFNSKELANILECSQGRILELRKEPVEGQVYHAADINAEAIYNFAIKKFSQDELVVKIEMLEGMCKSAKSRSSKYKVGDYVGSNKDYTIISVTKIYGVPTYVVSNSATGEIKAVSNKELAGL